MGVDLTKYQKTSSEGKAAKKYIAFSAGSKGFAIVADLQSKGIDVARLTEDILEKVVKG